MRVCILKKLKILKSLKNEYFLTSIYSESIISIKNTYALCIINDEKLHLLNCERSFF